MYKVVSPVDAMPPADEEAEPPQAYQHWVPVVVVAQQCDDEERDEDGHSTSKEQPRELHLSSKCTCSSGQG